MVDRHGVCYLVGAGPGDPGLVTLRAKELIEQAEVLVHDYLANPVLLGWAGPDCERVYVGKKAGDHTLPQGEINALIVKLCREGKRVVRLKGGDPFVFGRGGEEAEELARAGIAFEIVPGVTSGIAAPAYAGIPVTHREHCTQVTFVTGHEDPEKEESTVDWAQLAQAPGTLVLYMAVGRIRAIADGLMAAGKPGSTPVALIRWGTLPGQTELVSTLAEVANAVEQSGFGAPAITVIGPVVGCRQELDWLRRARPLLGQRIVVTRSREQASELVGALAALGAEVLEIPTIRTVEPTRREEFHELVQEAHKYDWLIFTSPNGVDRFFESFFTQYDDARSIGGVRIAAVGPGTAKRIRARHLAVDAMPKTAVAENLLEVIEQHGSVDNQTFLWVRPEEAREVLKEQLEAKGAIVDQAMAYRTVSEDRDPTGAVASLLRDGADWITFTSSSCAKYFWGMELEVPGRVRLASIGPVTSATLRELGHAPDVEAKEHDINGLVRALEEAVGGEMAE